MVLSSLLSCGVDASERHFPARERHDADSRLVVRHALAVEPGLDAAVGVAPLGRTLGHAMLSDVGLKFHITECDTGRAGCQAPTVIFFWRGAAGLK